MASPLMRSHKGRQAAKSTFLAFLTAPGAAAARSAS